MNDEFTRRCDDAIINLEEIKKQVRLYKDMIEYYRISGKIEGVALAKSYYVELLRLNADIANFDMK